MTIVPPRRRFHLASALTPATDSSRSPHELAAKIIKRKETTNSSSRSSKRLLLLLPAPSLAAPQPGHPLDACCLCRAALPPAEGARAHQPLTGALDAHPAQLQQSCWPQQQIAALPPSQQQPPPGETHCAEASSRALAGWSAGSCRRRCRRCCRGCSGGPGS